MKNRIRCLLILLAIAVCAGRLSAQEFGWEEIVAQTRQYNPTLKKAEATVQQAQENYRGSFSGFLPSVSANAGTSQSNNETAGFVRSYSYGLSGSISLFSGFSDLSMVRIKELDLKTARTSYTRTVSDTMFTVRRDFIRLLWAQNMVQLSTDILNQRTENLNMIQLKYESGSENKGSLMRVEADKVEAEYNLAQAKRTLASTQVALLRAMGRDDVSEIAVRGALTAAKPGAVTVKDLAARTPEYQSALYTLQKADRQITQTKSSFYPTLSLNGSTGRTGSVWAPDRDQWNMGLSLSYPLFSGGKNYYDVRAATLGRTISETALRETANTLETNLTAGYNDLIDTVDNVGVREKYLAASQKQAEIVSMKYINGLSSYQDWYTIENDYINSQRALLNSRRDAALSAAQWKNYLGEE
jgi:outer membrane protein TolC